MLFLEPHERIASVKLHVSESLLSFVLYLGVCEDRCHAGYDIGVVSLIVQNIAQRLQSWSHSLFSFNIGQEIQKFKRD